MTTSYITAYTGMVAPPYLHTFLDRNTGAPLNLTGATFTGRLQNQATGAITSMSGVWTVQFPVSAGVAQYQWTGADLSAIGTYSVFVSALLPSDTGPREFDPDVLIIIPSAEYLAALIGAIVVGTDINIAGLGAGGSTPVITNLPADVIDRVGRLLGHVIVDTLPAITGSVVAAGNPTSTATLTSVAGSAASVALIAANANRKSFYVYNDSAANLYIAYGATASVTAYTVKLPPSTLYEMPTNPAWQGAVSGIWDSATGAARITDVS